MAQALMVVLFGAGVVTAVPPQFSYEYKAGFVGAGNDVIPPETAASIEVVWCLCLDACGVFVTTQNTHTYSVSRNVHTKESENS